MLTNSRNADLYAEWLDYIDDIDTKNAFCFIVGLAACGKRFECHPQLKGAKGPIKDFRFIDEAGEQPFSFITNKRWLLFYFRPPAIRSNRYSREDIQRDFESFVENTAGEWTVKLTSVDDVIRLARNVEF